MNRVKRSPTTGVDRKTGSQTTRDPIAGGGGGVERAHAFAGGSGSRPREEIEDGMGQRVAVELVEFREGEMQGQRDGISRVHFR